MIDVFRHDPVAHTELTALLHAPSLYDEFLRHLSRRGLPVPGDRVDRDFTQPYMRHPGVVAVFKVIYENPKRWWDAYDMCEKLVDVEEAFQLWRFQDSKPSSASSATSGGPGLVGCGFLRERSRSRSFRMIDVRTEIGAVSATREPVRVRAA